MSTENANISNAEGPWWKYHSLMKFKTPCSICVVGATGSGKTYWTYKLLQNLNGMFEENVPKKVLYCYGIHQALYEDMEACISQLEFHEGIPKKETIEEFTKEGEHTLIIIDDLIDQLIQSSDMELLLTQGCHHKKCSVIYLTQNLFQAGKNARTIALNTWYLVLFRNLRDASQITFLAKQIYPGKGAILKQAYHEATAERYGYLLVDSSPMASEERRLRTHVFPGEDLVIYVPRL